MFTNIAAIIELIKLILDSYKFINNAIDEGTYRKAVSTRKKNYGKFIAADRAGRLEVLRNENEAD